MSAPVLTDSETDFVPPAMRMWEWFDMWALYEEWRTRNAPVLMEADDTAADEEESEEEKQKQHDEYVRDFKDILTDHTRMSRPERQARRQEVSAWARGEKGIHPDEAMRVRAGGHDLKSASAGFSLLDRALKSKHGHILSNAARHSREDKQKKGAEEDNEGEVMAHLMTRHGHAQSDEDPGRLRMIHKRLDARDAHKQALAAHNADPANAKDKKRITVDANSEHGFRGIARDTGATEDEVRSIHSTRQKGTHLSPIRNLANQMLAKVKKGERIGHKDVALAGANLIKKRNKALEGADRKAAQLKGAVETGAAEIKGKEGKESTTALDTAAYTPGQTRTALRMPKATRSGPRLHHPDSADAKRGGETLDSKDAHENLAARLGLKKNDAAINVHQAISKLYKQGEDEADIAKTLKTPLATVQGHIGRKRSGPGKARDSGGAPSSPVVTKLIGKEEQAKKDKAGEPTSAIQRDLHDLYPLRAPAKEGETEEEKKKRHDDFAAKMHAMVHGDPEKGVPPKPHAQDVSTTAQEKLGTQGSSSSYHSGFSRAGSTEYPTPLPSDATNAMKKAHQKKMDAYLDRMATAHEGVHKAMGHVLGAIADPKHPETVAHREHHSALKSAELSGDTNKVDMLKSEGKRKNIHDDFLAHHMNRAADRPEVQGALGFADNKEAPKQAVTAMGNIFSRVETHGKHYAGSAIARGGAEQKARPTAETNPKRRQKSPPGDPLSRARLITPGGGAIGTKGHKKAEFAEPDPKKAAAADAKARTARASHVPDAIERSTATSRELARARVAAKPKTVGTEPAGPKAPPGSQEKVAAEKADIVKSQDAQQRGRIPGAPGGVRPRGTNLSTLQRIRPAGTGKELVQPAGAGRDAPGRLRNVPVPKLRTEKPEPSKQPQPKPQPAPWEAGYKSYGMRKLRGEPVQEPNAPKASTTAGPIKQKKKKKPEPEPTKTGVTNDWRAALRAKVKPEETPKPAEPSSEKIEGLFVRASLVLNEGASLFSRLAGIV